jgi:protein-tyrosine phosphatase
MIDVHCHLLPNVDDGAKSSEMAIEMCAVAKADGITHIVCTPHANDEYSYDRKQHEQRLSQLRSKIGNGLELSLGCDFHFSYDNIQAVIADPEEFVIANGDYLLVELSDFALSPAIFKALEQIVAMEIRPIITHPERNLLLQRHADQVIRFVEKGCAIQVTANSLTGHWGEGPRKMVHWMLDHQAVHIIASDAHDPKFRPPVMSQARDVVATSFGQEVANALVQDNPGAVVRGEALPWFPRPRPA